MKTIECKKCFTHLRACNFQRHFDTCTGSYQPFKKATNCKYCNVDLAAFETANRANHIRWCDMNPKRSEYKNTNDGSQLRTAPAALKRAEAIKKAYADGKYDHVVRKGRVGFKHSEETKRKISAKALASPHRRLVRSIREYCRKDGNIVSLDSSWEEALAVRLDELDVIWIRPEQPIPYVTEDNKTHNYFPDFYLPEYDLYLDPKNPAAIKAQKDKLVILEKIMHNLVILSSLEECKNFQPTTPL